MIKIRKNKRKTKINLGMKKCTLLENKNLDMRRNYENGDFKSKVIQKLSLLSNEGGIERKNKWKDD